MKTYLIILAFYGSLLEKFNYRIMVVFDSCSTVPLSPYYLHVARKFIFVINHEFGIPLFLVIANSLLLNHRSFKGSYIRFWMHGFSQILYAEPRMLSSPNHNKQC